MLSLKITTRIILVFVLIVVILLGLAGFTATSGIANSGFATANGLGTSMANLGANGFTCR